MTTIEELIETRNAVSPDYAHHEFGPDKVAKGSHRAFVGGFWDIDGQKQSAFLTNHGLRPTHKLLDVGCGSLRAGRHFIDLLDPGNYYGIDANRQIIQAGYDVELTGEQRHRLPATNLRANDRFNVDFGVQFDMAIAQSVFTHISLNQMRLCLYRLAKVMRPGATFYATFCEQPLSVPIDTIYQRVAGGRDYLNEQNVFWYHRRDLRWAAKYSPWNFTYIGDWGGRYNQMMVAYTRLADADYARGRAAIPSPPSSAERLRRLTARARRRAARALTPG